MHGESEGRKGKGRESEGGRGEVYMHGESEGGRGEGESVKKGKI